MKRLLPALALCATACITTTPEGVEVQKADLREAARLNTQIGIEHMRTGHLNFALEKLSKAIEQDPDFAAAHSSLAFVYAQRGQPAEAQRHYRRALALDSDDPMVKNNFGIFLCSQGEIEDAEEYFLEAAQDRKYQTPEAAWTNAGVCVRRRPDVAKAQSYFREALKINPKFPDALAQLAVLSFDEKDYLRARAFIQRYEMSARPTAEMLWIAAQTERQLGDLRSAIRYESQLQSEFPDSDSADQLRKQKAQKGMK